MDAFDFKALLQFIDISTKVKYTNKYRRDKVEEVFSNNEFLNLYNSTIQSLDSMNYRNKVYYNVLFLWLKNKLNNKNIENYLLQKDIKTIAIYGAGNLGELLYDELKISNKVTIKYIIDQSNVNGSLYEVPVIKPEQIKEIESVDCIVVTPIYAFDVIGKNLKQLDSKNIICIDDIIIEMYRE